MNLFQLQPKPGARKKRKMLGKGRGTGQGKTSGKGHKGQNARCGGGTRPGFEGGQMPLLRRLPKRGFNNKRFQIKMSIVNLGDFEKYTAEKEVTPEILKQRGLIKGKNPLVKVLGNGELKKPLIIKAHAFTESAKQKIEQAQGKWVLI